MLRRIHLFVKKFVGIARTFVLGSSFVDGFAIDSVGNETRDIQLGRAYQFDGTNDYATINSFDPNIGSGDFYFSVVVNPNPTNTFMRLFSKSNTNFSFGFQGSGEIRAWVGGVLHISNTAVQPNTWHTIECVRQSGVLSFYIDGVLDGSFSSTGTILGSSAATVGIRSQIADRYRGYMHSMVLYNSASPDDNSNLIFFYKMDEGQASVGYDSSGNSNHLSLLNGVTHITLTDGNGADYQNQVGYTDNAGVLIPRDESTPTQDVQGNALQFVGRVKYNAKTKGRFWTYDGIDDYSDSAVSVSGDWCVSGRFNSKEIGQKKVYYSIGTFDLGSQGTGIFMGGTSPGNTIGYFGGSNETFIRTNVLVETNRRYHVLVNRTSLAYEIYVDGNLEVTYTGSTKDLNDFRIGARSDVPTVAPWGGVFKGDIYDVRVYSTTKSSAEVQSIYNKGIDINNIVAWYKMDEGGGNTLYDSIGGTNNASNFNNPSSGESYEGGSTYHNELGHSNNAGVSIPRDETNTTQDVQGNPLQYDNRGNDLLPGVKVNHNIGLAPELINLSVPVDYTYGETLPASMTKKTETNKEFDFIINK